MESVQWVLRHGAGGTVRAGCKGPGHLAWGALPLGDSRGQSVRCLEAACGHILLLILGGGGRKRGGWLGFGNTQKQGHVTAKGHSLPKRSELEAGGREGGPEERWFPAGP